MIPTWRVVLFRAILVALVLGAIVFWETAFGVVCILGLFGSIHVYSIRTFVDMELAQQFDNGIHVQGWK